MSSSTQPFTSPFPKDAFFADGKWTIGIGCSAARISEIEKTFPLHNFKIPKPLTILACASGETEPWLTLFLDAENKLYIHIERNYFESLFVVCGQSNEEVMRMMLENPTACLIEKRIWAKEVVQAGPFTCHLIDDRRVGWRAKNVKGLQGHTVGWLDKKVADFEKVTAELLKNDKELDLEGSIHDARIMLSRKGLKPWLKPWERDD